MCPEWIHSPEVFINWALINGWIKGLTIDRINNDKNYCPENCRFVTQSENNKNRREQKLGNTGISI